MLVRDVKDEGGKAGGGGGRRERTEMGQALLGAWSHLEFRIIIRQKYLVCCHQARGRNIQTCKMHLA